LSLHPITPDAEHINPISGFGRMFSLRNLLELVKSIFKLAVSSFSCSSHRRSAAGFGRDSRLWPLLRNFGAWSVVEATALVMAGLFLVLGGWTSGSRNGCSCATSA